MKLYNKQDNTTGKWRIIWFSIGLGVLSWFIDSLIDAFICKEGTLSSQIFSPQPHEIWMRLITISVLIFLGILAQQIINSNRKAEEGIRDISSQWQTTFSAINDAVFIADSEGKILRCNKSFANLLNKQESEIVGHTCHEVVHGTAYFIDGCPFVAAKDTHQREVIELEAGNKWFSVTVDPVLDDSGEIVSYVHSMSDITERKQFFDALKESEEKYRLLFLNSPIGVFHYDVRLHITECNNRFVNILQSSREKLIGLDMGTLNDKSVLPAINEVLKGNEGFYDGLYKATTSQAEIWVSMHTASIFDRDGKVKGGVGIVEDITESRRAGEKLRISEERFRSLAENIDQVFWFTELNPEKVLYVSLAFERIWGVTAEELYGNPRLWVDLIHIDDRQHVQEVFEAFISSNGRTPFKVEYRIKRQDGDIRWIYDRGAFIPSKEGQPQRISGVAEDITERKRTERVIKEFLRQQEAILNNIPDIAWLKDREGRFIAVNEPFGRACGVSPDALVGKTDLDIWPNDLAERYRADDREVIQSGKRKIVEEPLADKEGKITWIETIKTPIYGDKGEVIGTAGIARDISERKQIHEALAKTTQTLQSLFQASPVAIIVLNIAAEVTMWSPAAERIFSWKAEEVLGRFNPIIPEEKKDEFKLHCERILSGESFAGIEVERMRKDGSYIYVLLSTAPVFDQNGSVTGIIGILADITEQKRAEEELRKSEEDLKLYQALINQSHDSVEVLDPETGSFLNVNKRACEDLGYSREELLSMKVFDIDPMVKPADFPKIMEGFRSAGGGIWNGVHLRKDGTTFPVEVSLKLVQLDRSYVVAVARDITERKKLEEWIFQIKQDWEDTFNILTDMITVHDEDFNIIRYNTAAEKMLGLSFLNVKKEKCFQFYHGTTCPPAGCPSCMTFKTGVPSTVELFEPHLNMFIEIRAIPRFDSAHNLIGLIHVVRDITEQKKIENHLRQSQKMEAVGQLAGGVAHDFNNIITAIIGYASIMKMKAGQDDYFRGLIDNVLSASEKAANLVRSLLAFSRKQISNPEPVKINEIIKSIEKLLSMAVGDDIELKIELTEDLIVTADIVQLEQVMMNLCTNARDAMPGRGTLTIKTGAAELTRDFITAHGYGEEGRYALISVSDTGAGMDEDTRERIFEPFFTTKEVGKGTGLGLSIVYGIIKQHKGYIICQSEPGKGTTFNIYLPVVKSAMKELKRVEQAESAGPAITILFAEDEEEFRKLMRQVLESSGYNVIEAVDGEDALNKFMENNNIDLLLFDIIMPRMSGKEAYEKIRKMRPDVKALFISGYPADFTSKYGVLEEGMNLISKPVQPAKLLRKIIEALGNERAE